MALDPTLPLQIAQASQPQDPLAQYGKVLALKNALGQGQLQQQALQSGNLDLQQKQLAIDQAKALNAAYTGSVVTNADGTIGFDQGKMTDALKAAGHMEVLPKVIEGINGYQKSSADLTEAQGKVATLQADAGGRLAATVKTANNDPLLFSTLLQQAVAAKHIPAANVQPLLDKVQQAMQQDPTGQSARQVVGQISDQLIAGSPEQTKLATEAKAAAARQLTAQTGATTAAVKLPGEQAQSSQQVRSELASRLGAATSQAEYQKILGEAPFQVAREFDGKTPEQARKLGMTAEQQTQAGQAAANQQNEQQYRQQELAQSAARTGVEQQRNAREQQVYEQTYGAGANPALVGVLPAQRNQALQAAQKAADDYTKASAAQRDMKTFIDLARSGNKEAYAYIDPEGVLTLNTGRGVTRVNREEIDAYGGAGSFSDLVQGKAGKFLSGKSKDSSVIDAIEQLHNKISTNTGETYNQKLSGINQNYHANFKPIEAAQPSSGSGQFKVGDTVNYQGKPHKVTGVGADGKLTLAP